MLLQVQFASDTGWIYTMCSYFSVNNILNFFCALKNHLFLPVNNILHLIFPIYPKFKMCVLACASD
jgi:hypothetical protein